MSARPVMRTIFLVVEEGSSPRKFLNVPLKRHIGTSLRIFLLSPCTVHVLGCEQSMGLKNDKRRTYFPLV